MRFNKNKKMLPIKSLIESSNYIDISNKWKEYFSTNAIVRIETNIKQKNKDCKKIESSIKWIYWKVSFLPVIFLILLMVWFGSFSGGYDMVAAIPAILLFSLVWELLKASFGKHDREDESNLTLAIYYMIPNNVNTNTLELMGTVKMEIYNDVTENSTMRLLGHMYIDLDIKNGPCLVIVDTEKCKIIGIKEFHFQDIKKYVISKDLSNIEHIKFLERSAERFQRDADVASLKRDSFNSTVSATHAAKAKVEAREAYYNMDRLYILFEDGSQFLLSDLTSAARNLKVK
jgi:hypothetical protein